MCFLTCLSQTFIFLTIFCLNDFLIGLDGVVLDETVTSFPKRDPVQFSLQLAISSNCANDSLPVSVFASARLVKPQPVSSVSIGSCEDWCQICIDALGPTAIRYVQQKHPTLQRPQTFGTYLCI